MRIAFTRLSVARIQVLLLLVLVVVSTAADARHPLAGDVDCDGHADAISYAVKPDTVRVDVKFGQKGHTAQSLTFAIGAHSQNSLCAAPTSVSLESLDFDPRAEEMGELPGFQRSKICKGIVLDDQQCDPIHIYWDHDAHRLAWWRN